MLKEQCSLQRFGEVVTGHFLCGGVFHADLFLFDAISDEKILHVNMTAFLSTLILHFTLHEDGALVILVYDILVYPGTLPL